ncbi:hypothetical protein LTR36_002919 [Oleoguttula mirabilis]|uniref:Transmembrane protein n=1 Tax=Oleoguttula mirabilis TaxID=1507867 RepID=A0AAV9JJI4_9PEZI|nr:hypothetical protein LTR36_002919 [Oleoguttula mirabilis]
MSLTNGDARRPQSSSGNSKHFGLQDVPGDMAQDLGATLSARMFLPPRGSRQDDEERSRGDGSAPPSAPPSAPGSPMLGPRGRSTQMVRDEEPLLSGSARAVSASRRPHDSEKQQVVQSGNRIKYRLLLSLTVMSAVLFLLNILQIALLEYVSSVAWIVGAPLVALALMSGALVVWMLRHRMDLMASWRGADAAARTVWIGVFLTIMVPTLVCEFIYMNFTAVPAWKTTVWTTSLDTQEYLRFPSFTVTPVVVNADWSFNWTGSGLPAVDCQVNYDPNTHNGQGVTNCTNNVKLLGPSGNPEPPALLFDAETSPIYIENSQQHVDLTLNFFLDNANTTDQLALLVSFFDPALTKIVSANGGPACNNPDKFTTYGAHSYGGNQIYLKVQTVVDQFNALNNQSAAESPSCSNPGLRTYDYYPASGFYTGSGTPAHCVLSSDSVDQTANCQTQLSIFFDSFLVQKQTSERGTNWKRMLLDEGSIVGAICFVMWFLTIYVL